MSDRRPELGGTIFNGKKVPKNNCDGTLIITLIEFVATEDVIRAIPMGDKNPQKTES
jgi:hypothetical protein